MPLRCAAGPRQIPATVIEASREDQFLMSLIENIARRAPSNRDIVREVMNLKMRGYLVREIAVKLGRDLDYISAIVRLIENDDAYLVEAVEAHRIPITIALLISRADDPALQSALSQAYESGALRGTRFKEAKRVIAQHSVQRSASGQSASRHKLTGEALVREYQQRTREQQALVRRANQTRERLLMLKSAMGTLLAVDHFVTLLRAEQLHDIPAQLLDEKA